MKITLIFNSGINTEKAFDILKSSLDEKLCLIKPSFRNRWIEIEPAPDTQIRLQTDRLAGLTSIII